MFLQAFKLLYWLHFLQGISTSTEITCFAKWSAAITAAITYVDRQTFQKPGVSINQCFLKYTKSTGAVEREREREREIENSLRCNLCRWALLNLLANGKWFTTADWLIRLRHGGMCCSVSSPWHSNHRKHTLPCCILAPSTSHSSHYRSWGRSVKRGGGGAAHVCVLGGGGNKPSLT